MGTDSAYVMYSQASKPDDFVDDVLDTLIARALVRSSFCRLSFYGLSGRWVVTIATILNGLHRFQLKEMD